MRISKLSGFLTASFALFLGMSLPAVAQIQTYSSAAEALNDPNACWLTQEIERGQAPDEIEFVDVDKTGVPGSDPRFNNFTDGYLGRDQLGHTAIFGSKGKRELVLIKVPCGQGSSPPLFHFPDWAVSDTIEITSSLGVYNSSTSLTNLSSFSAGLQDVTTRERMPTSGTGFVGGLGFDLHLDNETTRWIISQQQHSGANVSRYAPEAKNAYAAYFPLKAPPKPQQPRWSWGVDGNVYFFAGGDPRFTGIPGGPFGTATGTDSFKISNNVMFTLGGYVTVPLPTSLKVSLTGGVAELNQTVKYSCATFCAVLPATPAFTVSQDRWLTGGYVGGRVAMPITLPGLRGANIALDYKHVFFGSYTDSLGSIATRQVNARLSPDMDLVTVRLGVPFH